MSTLTKVLIILQTVFSIFLCGLIVTYVANANNYKDMYDTASNQARSAKARQNSIEKDWDDFKKEKEDESAKNLAAITELKDQINTLNGQIKQLNAEKLAFEDRIRGLSATVETANTSALEQTKLYTAANSRLTTLESDQIRLKKEYDETNATLIEKMAIIASQDKKIRELQEEKSELQGRLEQYLQQYGKTAEPPVPVTQDESGVQMAQGIQPIGLKGTISDLDLENKLAEITVGAADGVKKEMKFQVTRGDQFICHIVVLDVDAERSVGILDTVQQPPRIGDKVSTF